MTLDPHAMEAASLASCCLQSTPSPRSDVATKTQYANRRQIPQGEGPGSYARSMAQMAQQAQQTEKVITCAVTFDDKESKPYTQA